MPRVLVPLLLTLAMAASALAENRPGRTADERTIDPNSVDAFSLEPETASALMAMSAMLRQSCQSGQQRSCSLNDSLHGMGETLLVARRACARGNERGCRAAEKGATRIAELYERFQRATGATR